MEKIITPKFRVSYPELFKPCVWVNGEKKVYPNLEDADYKDAKFSIIMLFDKSQDISELKRIVKQAIEEKWPDKTTRPTNIILPFKDGDIEKPDKEGYENTIFVKATMNAVNKSTGVRQRPDIMDTNLQYIRDEVDFYAGCYARAKINAYPYEVGPNKGVSFGLGNIQKMGDGEPFSGRTRGENDFEAISSGAGESIDGVLNNDEWMN